MNKSRILIVEDELVVAKDLSRRLERAGYAVIGSVPSGEESIAATERDGPDLVIMDVVLAGEMDGTEAAWIIRNRFDVPVVYLSAHTENLTLKRASATQPFGYLVKPVADQELAPAIEMALQKHRVEKRLRESERRHRSLVETIPYGIIETDLSGLVQFVNSGFLRMVGAEKAELVGTDLSDLMASDDERSGLEQSFAYLADKRPSPETWFGRMRRKDGELIQIQVDWNYAYDPDGRLSGFVAVVTDVTERKIADEKLRRTSETIQALLNATSDMVCLLDANGRILAGNETFRTRLAGLDEEIPGADLSAVWPDHKGGPPCDGLEEVFKTAAPVRCERTFDGAVFDVGLYPVFDDMGSVRGVALFARDITENKKTENMLLRSERIKAVGEMASGVAHNFNNLLQIVMGSARLAVTNLEMGDLAEAGANLEQILQTSRLGADTIRRLQHFARSSRVEASLPLKVFDLSDTVAQAVEMTKPFWRTKPHEAGIDIALKQDLTPACLIEGRESELFEVVVNLVNNAVEALPEGGVIDVLTRIEDTSVVLVVSDTGVGIRANQRDLIFQPFWTTKEYHGTGMGLASVRGIVTAHAGSIEVKSEVGRGAVFTVKLPLAAAREAVGAEDPGAESESSLRMLIVDDMEAVVRLLESGLTKCGHRVLAAMSGKEAVEIFKEVEVDVVICDLGMPEMNGWETAAAIRRICMRRGRPGVPFIMLTGWGEQACAHPIGADAGVDMIMSKPVELPELAAAARDLAAQRTG